MCTRCSPRFEHQRWLGLALPTGSSIQLHMWSLRSQMRRQTTICLLQLLRLRRRRPLRLRATLAHSLPRPGSLYTQSPHSHWRNNINPESWNTFSKLRSFTILRRSCDLSCWRHYDWCSTGVFILQPPLLKTQCPNFFDFWYPLGKLTKRSGLIKGVKLLRRKSFKVFF